MPPKPTTGSKKTDSTKAPSKAGKVAKKRPSRRTPSYAIYIDRVSKRMHPELGVTRRSMSVLNSYVVDLFDRITNEASRLVRYNKKATLSSREIQTAVRIVLPGALAKHATEHAIHATAKYQNSFGKKSADATPSTPEST